VPSLLGGHSRPLQSWEIRLVQSAVQTYDNPGAWQGDTFVIDVVDELSDTSMDVVTSIVSISDPECFELLMSMFSIGMVFTSIASTPTTARPS
jgi:hypothetical protein